MGQSPHTAMNPGLSNDDCFWGGATQRLARLVGYGRTMEMILTGEPIDAQEAFRIGLVSKVVSAKQLMKVFLDKQKKE